MSYYVGIDPGKKGAFAVIDSYGDLIAIEKTVTAHDLTQLLRTYRPRHVFVEKAQAMPGQGVSSMFAYGQGFGELLGVLTATGIAYTLIRPSTWTKPMHQGTAGDEPKKRSAEAFMRLFPASVEKTRLRSGRLHDGIVDAALIATYGLRHVMVGQV